MFAILLLAARLRVWLAVEAGAEAEPAPYEAEAAVVRQAFALLFRVPHSVAYAAYSSGCPLPSLSHVVTLEEMAEVVP